VVDLSGFFDTSIYLSEHSDLVALMVLGHQTRVHNLITFAHEETKKALGAQEAVRITRGVEITEGDLLPTTEVAIDHAIDRLLREMFFVGEAPLEGPVRGTSRFASEFERRGPHDGRGRSLRDFDLERRLFTYPLSFLIYSDAFDALPDLVKRRAYRRIRAILANEDPTDVFRHLDAATRRAIHEILLDTQPDYERYRP